MTTIIVILCSIIIILLILNFVIPKGLNLREIDKLIDHKEYDKAKKLLQKGINYNKFSPDAHFLMAKIYLLIQQFDYALMELKSIIKNHKFGVMAIKDEIYNMLGETYIKLNKIDDAYQQYLLLESEHPDEYNVTIHLAKILFLKKEYEKAINYYNRSLKLRGTDSEAIGGLGICYYQLGDLKKTHEYLEQAVKLDRKNYTAHYYYALFYYKKELYDYAISEYEKALVDKSFKLRCLYGIGICYKEKEVNVRAIDTFEQAVRLIEQTADKIKNYNRRINYLKNPFMLEIRYKLAEAYTADKNIASAIDQWQEIDTVNSEYKDVHQKIIENARYGKDRIQDLMITKEMDFEKITRFIVSNLGYVVKKLKVKDKEEIIIEAQGVNEDVFQGISVILFKRSFHPVGEREVSVFYDKMQKHNIKNGLIISAHGFAPTAIRYGLGKSIDFVGKNQIMRLLKKYEYRV